MCGRPIIVGWRPIECVAHKSCGFYKSRGSHSYVAHTSQVYAAYKYMQPTSMCG